MVASHTVARSAVAAAREAGAKEPPHPAVWQPWQQLGTDAATRFRTEIAAALAELERTAGEAGRLLDIAYSTAAGASHPLREAALSAFTKYMTAADETTAAVMTPAIQAYDAAIAAGHSAYHAALADAAATYKRLLADAQQAKSEAAAIPGKV